MDTNSIEICCASVQSVCNAKAGGATRVELCQALTEGGTSPSYALMKAAAIDLGMQVFALIRPRGGDFVYNELEIKTMEEDVRMCKQLGATGIVIGFLTKDGNIDTALTRKFVQLAAPLPVTFHRAFDDCADPLAALEQVIECGCKRILTSGCKPTATEGSETLKRLVEKAAGRVTILAGSGITPENALKLKEFTGVQEIHGSCKKIMPNGATETDAETVKALLNELLA